MKCKGLLIHIDEKDFNKEVKVEMEIVLQLFKIIFDPYTPIDEQITLITELRKIAGSLS